MDPPCLELLEDGVRHVLKREWSIRVGGRVYTVPSGFVTDGASQHLFKRYGIGVTEAALLHDYIYNTPSVDTSRKDTDIAFTAIQLAGARHEFTYHAARRYRERRLHPATPISRCLRIRLDYKRRISEALVMYLGVRAGGWMFYKKRKTS